MKKIGVLFICTFLILSFTQLFNIQAQDMGDLEDQIQEGVDRIEDAKGIFDEGKWDYLGREWKEILLKRKFVSAIDGFFTKISVVFRILFGEPYSLSLPLFFVIVLWLYFFFKFSEIFTDYSSFSSLTANVIGLGLTIILAQFQILRNIVEFFGWLVFSQEANIWRFLIVLGIFVGLMLIYYLTSHFGDVFKKSKEEREKREARTERKKAKEERGEFRNFLEKFLGAFRK